MSEPAREDAVPTTGPAGPASPPTDGPTPAVGTGPAGLGDAPLPPPPDEDTGIGYGPRGRRLGLPELLVGAVVYVAIQGLAGLALITATGALPSAPVLLAVSALSAFGAVAVALALRVRSLAAIGFRRVPWRTIGLAVLLGLAVWVVSRVLIVVYVSVTGDLTDPQAALTQFSGGAAAAWVVLLGGLAVPLGEELLFRGIGYGSLRRFGVIVATTVSSLVFALAHGLNVVFLAVLVLAVLNAVLYERTRSIWPCFVTHATFNLTSFAILLIAL
ncbi:type II CAAX endopeptidase family protein [Actinomycetospora chiangmaiensis]|uniref:type II CAAX endopeptidase family protein n=1 Tax=Actinomycetospora chiangmaiensis TaxID=402650 RepID=UPI0003813D64|nr:type II CAAX endopeptidase family protein [Actinomycetospora chiangmaiensis]